MLPPFNSLGRFHFPRCGGAGAWAARPLVAVWAQLPWWSVWAQLPTHEASHGDHKVNLEGAGRRTQKFTGRNSAVCDGKLPIQPLIETCLAPGCGLQLTDVMVYGPANSLHTCFLHPFNNHEFSGCISINVTWPLRHIAQLNWADVPK